MELAHNRGYYSPLSLTAQRTPEMKFGSKLCLLLLQVSDSLKIRGGKAERNAGEIEKCILKVGFGYQITGDCC